MAPKTEQKIYVGIGLDFETGGLDCRECACTQIALQAVRCLLYTSDAADD